MEHERDRKVDTFGFGVDQHEDQKRGFALAEIDRKDPLNGSREASHFGRWGIGKLEEIERINFRPCVVWPPNSFRTYALSCQSARRRPISTLCPPQPYPSNAFRSGNDFRPQRVQVDTPPALSDQITQFCRSQTVGLCRQREGTTEITSSVAQQHPYCHAP